MDQRRAMYEMVREMDDMGAPRLSIQGFSSTGRSIDQRRVIYEAMMRDWEDMRDPRLSIQEFEVDDGAGNQSYQTGRRIQPEVTTRYVSDAEMFMPQENPFYIEGQLDNHIIKINPLNLHDRAPALYLKLIRMNRNSSAEVPPSDLFSQLVFLCRSVHSGFDGAVFAQLARYLEVSRLGDGLSMEQLLCLRAVSLDWGLIDLSHVCGRRIKEKLTAEDALKVYQKLKLRQDEVGCNLILERCRYPSLSKRLVRFFSEFPPDNTIAPFFILEVGTDFAYDVCAKITEKLSQKQGVLSSHCDYLDRNANLMSNILRNQDAQP